MSGRRSGPGSVGASPAPEAPVPAGFRGPPDARHADRLGLAAWLGALVLGTAAFHAIGAGVLSPPPPEPSGWGAWAAGRDPLVAAVALLRLLVLALSWYLVGTTSMGIVARVVRGAGLLRIADALTLPPLRRLLQGAMGVSLASVMVTSVVPTGDPGTSRPASVTLRAAGEEAEEPDELTVVFAALGDDRITLEHVDGSPPLPLRLLDRAVEAQGGPATDAVDDERAEVGSDEAATSAHDDTGAGAAVDVHVVVPGESFWTIAQDALGSNLGRQPTETESLAYWRHLIDTNRDRLVDRDNADLIFPGQELELPSGAPTTAPGSG